MLLRSAVWSIHESECNVGTQSARMHCKFVYQKLQVQPSNCTGKGRDGEADVFCELRFRGHACAGSCGRHRQRQPQAAA